MDKVYMINFVYENHVYKQGMYLQNVHNNKRIHYCSQCQKYITMAQNKLYTKHIDILTRAILISCT